MVPVGSLGYGRSIRLIAALVALHCAAADFLTSPRVLWSVDMDGTTTRGNAVTLSQDNSRLLLTTEQGDLHILLASDPSNSEQSLRFVPEYDSGSSIACASGAAVFPTRQHQVDQENSKNPQYAVYAIQELDKGSSKVIAVDIRSARQVWSIRVEGFVSGSPVVNDMGNRIYVTHNTQTTGAVSVIAVSHDFESASLVETLESSDSVQTMAPLTPPTLQSTTIQSDSNNDDDASSSTTLQDIVVFAEMDTESPDTGSLYVLLSRHGGSSDTRELRLASEYPRAAMARPALSKDGLDIYLGQASARITGWDSADNDLASVLDGTSDNVFPAWEQRLSEEVIDAQNDPLQDGKCYELPWNRFLIQ